MDMKDVLLPVLVSEDAKYSDMYLSQVRDDLPGKREWVASLEADASEYDVSEYFVPIEDTAKGTDDPAEILALLKRLEVAQKVLKEQLQGIFAGINNAAANRTDGVATPEDLQAQLKKVRETFAACVTMANQGHMTLEDIKTALTLTDEEGKKVAERWEMRNVRGGTTTFSYRPVGTVKVRTVTTNVVGPKSNTKRVRLVVNGELSPEVSFGEACRKAGVVRSELQKLIEDTHGKKAWTDEANYSDNMVMMNDQVYGLRIVNS
jgi:hypothetical protein